MDKTMIIDHLCRWLRMLSHMEVTMPQGLAIPNQFGTGNQYLI